MILLDTSYLVALLNPQDELHLRAVAWGSGIREQMLVTEQVIWEVLNYFSRPAHRIQAHALVEQVLADPIYEFVPTSPPLFAAARRFYRQHADKAWSFTDCTSFVVMRERAITRALTHDTHFEQAGFEALLRRDPPA